MRYLDFHEYDDIYRMSIAEYEQRITAYKLKMLDKQLFLHQQAWLNVQAKAQKKQGKNMVPVYKTFEDFFDFKKLEREITGELDELPIFVNK